MPGSGDGRELAVGRIAGPQRLGGASARRPESGGCHQLLFGMEDPGFDGEFALSRIKNKMQMVNRQL